MNLKLLCSAILVFVLISLSDAQAQSRRAVVIGIDEYVRPGMTPVGRGDPPDPRFWLNLDGAVNDSERIYDLLIARFGFAADDIVHLRNDEAERDDIIAAIEDHLIDKTEAGDIAFLYYAGHGSRVRNSLSTEADMLDESIVPADAAGGALDIRDKELRDLVNRVIDKGGEVTVILDSCHSGSATRGVAGESPGKTRMLAFDPRDVQDGSTAASPWERGALVMSATQRGQLAHEDEDEFGISGGAFTLALTRALRTSAPDEPAQNLFRRISALMKASGKNQDVGLEATGERRARALFGGSATGETGRSVASVESVGDRVVRLQEGKAAGLTVATELVKVGAEDIRIRITAVDGLISSRAAIVSDVADSQIAIGDLFVVDRWAPPEVPNLAVWVPRTGLGRDQLVTAGRGIAAAVQGRGHEWVVDPTLTTPSHSIRFDGESWEMSGPAAGPVEIGAELSVAGIEALLPPAETPGVAVFLNLPAPQTLAGMMQFGADTDNNAIESRVTPAGADYHLIGRFAGSGVEYAWVRPWVSSAGETTLPWITRWVPMAGPLDRNADELETLAVRLGYLNAWLRLEGPPESPDFPYRLSLKQETEDRFVSDGAIYEGEAFELALTTDRSSLNNLAWRYIYVFSLDSSGASTLLYPRGGATTDNRYPPEGDELDPQSVYVLPDSIFDVGAPFGIDTFVLIATTTQLPDPTIFDSTGVRAGVARSFDQEFRLEDLLRGVGAKSRATIVRSVPTRWSIERLFVESMP